jgi:hypothetical protein
VRREENAGTHSAHAEDGEDAEELRFSWKPPRFLHRNLPDIYC